MARMIKIRVPATSANLGPGFDCLGLALDVWQEVSIEPAERITYQVEGEGAEKLNKSARNLFTKAFARVHEICGEKLSGAAIYSKNGIFVSSGLGSSAAAVVGGLSAANELLGMPMNSKELLKLAAEMEGHPDNAAPALFGGLVVSVTKRDEIITHRHQVPDLTVLIVTPQLEWLTKTARAVLPKSYPRSDVIFNIGRAALVVDALRTGDLDLLKKVMDDRIHQPYRLRHISGGTAAIKAARQFGAAALSGSGPSIIVFPSTENAAAARDAICGVFMERGIEARGLITRPSNLGMHRL
jgi:homoserine kinase